MVKKKKNVIMITIDAFYYEYIGAKTYKKTATPFLDSLIKREDVTSIENMYSEAPYTEAALMSLLGGINTADNGSYMKRLKNTDCVLEEFKKKGYTVFANCYQSSIYPSGALTGINDIYYNASFNFKNCWEYRIKYYKEKYEKNNLSLNDKKLILDILNDNFKEALEFLKCIKNKSNKIELIYDKLDVSDVVENISFVNNEYEKYKKDSEKYLNELFELGEEHPILKLNSYGWNHKIDDRKVLNEIERRFLPFVKKVYWKNLFYNIKNNQISSKKLLYLFKKNKKEFLNYIKVYISSIIDRDLLDRVKASTYNSVKTVASANTSFKHFEKWITKQNKTPFFAYLHIDDIHFREMFFTHDTKDLKLLNDEFLYAENYIKDLPNNYKGSLCYDLGVHYVDKQLEYLFSFLEKNGLLDNTDIIITADHGNSYTYQVPRENYVINFYEENYHVPCIIYSKDKKLNINQNNYYQTKDIPATILELNNIKVPDSYKGNSMLNFNGRDYAIIEYSGSGCPNLLDRPLYLGIKTKKYKIGGEVLIKDGNYKIKEIYDLQRDQKENINLINSIDYNKIDNELKLINEEIENIKKSNQNIFN